MEGPLMDRLSDAIFTNLPPDGFVDANLCDIEYTVELNYQ